MFALSIYSLKGGVGKTSITLGLASAALNSGISTLVIDLDPQGDTTLGLLGKPGEAPDIAEVIASARTETTDRAIIPTPWSKIPAPNSLFEPKLDLIAGTYRSARLDSPALDRRQVRRLGEALNKKSFDYDLVLIDCPPSLNGLTQMGLSASDRSIVVSEPGIFAVSAADRAMKLAEELIKERLAPRLQPLGIVVNRFRPRSVEHQYRLTELKSIFGDRVLEPVLEERIGLQQAQGGAVPLHLYEGESAKQLALDFDELLQNILNSKQFT